MKTKKVFKYKEEFKKIKRVLNVILLTFVILFISFVLLQRFTNNKFAPFGCRMFTVVSGSMAPKYNVGDFLIVKTIKPEDIKIGDTLTYKGLHGSVKDKIITHEVVKITEEEETGDRLFLMQGLANISADPIVKEEQIFGKVTYKVGIISFIYKIIRKPIWFLILIVIPTAGIIGYEIIMFFLDKEEERRRKR